VIPPGLAAGRWCWVSEEEIALLRGAPRG